MNLEQLLKIVRPCNILDPERILDAIEEKTSSKYQLYRGAFCKYFQATQIFCELIKFVFIEKGPEENVASAKFNSKAILGELRSALLDGDVTNYDMEKGI